MPGFFRVVYRPGKNRVAFEPAFKEHRVPVYLFICRLQDIRPADKASAAVSKRQGQFGMVRIDERRRQGRVQLFDFPQRERIKRRNQHAPGETASVNRLDKRLLDRAAAAFPGFDFDVVIYVFPEKFENFIEKRDLLPRKRRTEPCARVEAGYNRILGFLYRRVEAGGPFQAVVVDDHQLPGFAAVDVEFHAGNSVLEQLCKGCKGIFRCRGGTAPVAE